MSAQKLAHFLRSSGKVIRKGWIKYSCKIILPVPLFICIIHTALSLSPLNIVRWNGANRCGELFVVLTEQWYVLEAFFRMAGAKR